MFDNSSIVSRIIAVVLCSVFWVVKPFLQWNSEFETGTVLAGICIALGKSDCHLFGHAALSGRYSPRRYATRDSRPASSGTIGRKPSTDRAFEMSALLRSMSPGLGSV
mgnify:CR=1 FL=1